MTTTDLRQSATANLVSTYFALARATPGSRDLEDESFVGSVGEIAHPICNFAAGQSFDPWAARRLRALSIAHPTLHAYVLPGDASETAAELLRRADFRLVNALCEMTVEPARSEVPTLRPAFSAADRRSVANFMADQFFPRQSAFFRHRVTDTLAAAEQMELFSLVEHGRRVAAMMLSRAHGVLGVYNLCVASNRRGTGIGRDLVRWSRNEGAKSGAPVILQCEAKLKPWYELQGFRHVGEVAVYCLSPDVSTDIMEVVPVH